MKAARTSLPESVRLCETLIRESLPADWDWSPAPAEIKRNLEATGRTPFRDCKHLTIWALLQSYGRRHSDRNALIDAMGICQKTLSNLMKAHGEESDKRRYSESARAAAQQLAEILIGTGRKYAGALKDFEGAMYVAAARVTAGNLRKAAYGLGIHRNTIFLWKKAR